MEKRENLMTCSKDNKEIRNLRHVLRERERERERRIKDKAPKIRNRHLGTRFWNKHTIIFGVVFTLGVASFAG